MPGPSFFTPRRVTPSLPQKRFSLAKAEKSLPLVKRIVGDIVHAHDQAAPTAKPKIEKISESKEQTRVQQVSWIPRWTGLQDLVDELSDVGCELKDYQTGLIDFVGRHQGQDVYLCWKLGEEKILYWHEMSAGFAGRKPIAMLEGRRLGVAFDLRAGRGNEELRFRYWSFGRSEIPITKPQIPMKTGIPTPLNFQ